MDQNAYSAASFLSARLAALATCSAAVEVRCVYYFIVISDREWSILRGVIEAPDPQMRSRSGTIRANEPEDAVRAWRNRMPLELLRCAEQVHAHRRTSDRLRAHLLSEVDSSPASVERAFRSFQPRPTRRNGRAVYSLLYPVIVRMRSFQVDTTARVRKRRQQSPRQDAPRHHRSAGIEIQCTQAADWQ
jgi:hypothetical protein